MAFLFYASTSGKTVKQLQTLIRASIPKEEIEIYRSFSSLSHRLEKPLNDLNVAILFASSMEDLSDILALQDRLWDMRIILIIPDKNNETIVKGHQLRPRFLTYADCNPTEVVEVLCNMLKRYSHA